MVAVADASGVDWVSCPSAGNYGAGGGDINRADIGQAFVINEHQGRWGKAITVHAPA